MERIWLKNYPPDVPAEINPDVYESIVQVFNESVAKYADRDAFYNLGKTLSYREIDLHARHFAAYLQQSLNLKKGSRFAIMLPNLLQYPIALFGALRAGLIVVNVNPLYTHEELAYQLKDAEVEGIICATNFAATLQKAIPQVPSLKHIILTNIGDMFNPIKRMMIQFILQYVRKMIPAWEIPNAHFFNDVIQKGSTLTFTPVDVRSNDIAFLQYTGGTTGVSKGAILTHRNLVANILQADAWFHSQLVDREIIITALPLYHIFSLTANCLYFTKIGGLNVLITNPRDTNLMISEMKKFKFTAITGVNTLFNALLKNPHFRELDFSHLHLALGGGMAVQRVVAEEWLKVTKAPLLEAYGLTETSPCATINPITMKEYNGFIGLPVSSTDVCILDANQQEVPLNTSGELAIKGPQVMRGYWKKPEETEKVFTKDGWLLTGDIGQINEEGYVRLLERKKDMILVSGFNVYPNEIEDIIARIPGVREVAVVGIPNSSSGEVPKAFVVKDKADITEKSIIDYCRQHLTGYKIPKQIVFIQELPKTNVGKILRRALRDLAVDTNHV